MPYTIGTSHGPFTGTGSFVIAKPAGIRTIVTNIPAWTGHENESPRRYFRLGRFTLGNSHGFSESQLLEYAQQLAYPISPIWELLAYDINDGASCTFYELVDVPDLTQLAPWDRTPLPWAADVRTTMNGNNTGTVGFSYTVPTGRHLVLARLRVNLIRYTVATSMVSSAAYIQLAGSVVAWAQLASNVVGVMAGDDLNSGPLVMNAGQSLVGTYSCSDTGGQVIVQISASGTLFDA